MTEPSSAIVIMGTSGCGKSTLGKRLAAATGYSFIEGDDLHPSENIAKMVAGTALTDEDRWPWLERIASDLNRAYFPDGRIISCSALKRSYRDFLRRGVEGAVLFVFPQVDHATLRERMRRRENHYMPASLLASQLSTLEVPRSDEQVLILDGTSTPEQLVANILTFLSSGNTNSPIAAQSLQTSYNSPFRT